MYAELLNSPHYCCLKKKVFCTKSTKIKSTFSFFTETLKTTLTRSLLAWTFRLALLSAFAGKSARPRRESSNVSMGNNSEERLLGGANVKHFFVRKFNEKSEVRLRAFLNFKKVA